MSEHNRLAPIVLLGDLVLPSIAWGISLTLVVRALKALNRKAATLRRRNTKLILLRVYIGFLFLLCTVQLAATIGAKSEQPNPSMAAFADIEFENLRCPGIKGAANVFFVINLFMTDGLLLWRCWILYNSCTNPLRMAVRSLLVFAFAGILGVGITHLALELRAFTGLTLSFIFIGTLAVNCIFSILIAARLFFHRNNARKIFGSGYGKHYISIATMVLESAAINVVIQIPAVVFPFAFHGAQFFGVPIVAQVQGLSTFLLMSRVVREDAWKQPSEVVLSRMQFSDRFQSTKESGRLSSSITATASSEVGHSNRRSDMRVYADV